MPSPLTPPSSSKKIHPLVDKMTQSIESARESIVKYRSTGNLEILLPYFEMILINKEILPIV